MHTSNRLLLPLIAAGLLVLGTTADGAVPSPGVKVTCDRTATTSFNITGTWSANDGGTYWIRQTGSCVWWAGFSGSPDTPTMGRNFANVFVGTVTTKGLVTGYWTDLPRGATANAGTLNVQVLGRPASRLTRRAVTGPFTGAVWSRLS